MARNRDDDDDDVDVGKKPLSGLEGMYANTNMAVLIIFSVCCNICYLPLILSAIAFFTSTDEKAKNNAKLCMIISGIICFLGTIGGIANSIMGVGR